MQSQKNASCSRDSGSQNNHKKKRDSMCPNHRSGNRRALKPKGALKKREKMETPNGTAFQGRAVYGRERDATEGRRGQTGWREEGGGGSET